MVRRGGDGHRGAPAGGPKPEHRRAIIVRKVNHIGMEVSADPSNRLANPRETHRLARVVARRPKEFELLIEAGIGSEVQGDGPDTMNWEIARGGVLLHHRQDFDLVPGPTEPSEDIEPEVLVSGVTEGQHPLTDDQDAQRISARGGAIRLGDGWPVRVGPKHPSHLGLPGGRTESRSG